MSFCSLILGRLGTHTGRPACHLAARLPYAGCVTAPWEEDDTSIAYLANTPVL